MSQPQKQNSVNSPAPEEGNGVGAGCAALFLLALKWYGPVIWFLIILDQPGVHLAESVILPLLWYLIAIATSKPVRMEIRKYEARRAAEKAVKERTQAAHERRVTAIQLAETRAAQELVWRHATKIAGATYPAGKPFRIVSNVHFDEYYLVLYGDDISLVSDSLARAYIQKQIPKLDAFTDYVSALQLVDAISVHDFERELAEQAEREAEKKREAAEAAALEAKRRAEKAKKSAADRAARDALEQQRAEREAREAAHRAAIEQGKIELVDHELRLAWLAKQRLKDQGG